MTMRIYCPACRTPFDVDDSLAGEKGMCPSCENKFTIRRPESSLPPAATLVPGSIAGAPLPVEEKPCALAATLAVVVMAAYGGAMIWAFTAYPQGSTPPRIFQVGGMFHPVLLHLPIGMLLAALPLDFFGGRGRVHSGAVTWLLWLSLLSSVAAALAGYFLGLKGYNTPNFQWHMWSGLAVPVVTGITLVTKLIHDSKPTMATGIYRLPLLATTAAITMAGHFGGEISHGFDLPKQIQSLLNGPSTAGNVPLEERTVYDAVIAPLMAAKCNTCHGDKKQKGDLRLDTVTAMLKAGESGNASVVPGKSAESESIKRIELAPDDDDHMPPKDKDQFTADEIAVLKWWIDTGAKEDVKIKDAGLAPDMKARVIKLASAAAVANGFVIAQDAPPAAPPAPAPAAPAPAAPPAPVPAPQAAPAPAAAAPAPAAPAADDGKAAAIEKELGITLLPVAQNDQSLTFNCVNVADKFGDAELGKLAPVADRLVDLNLSRSKVTDAGLATVAGMKNLKRLNLANTAVTDAGIDHLAGLAALEYLNLVGTKATDAALPKLEKSASLKKLYVWQTGVTKPAAEALHQKLPAIAINLGWDSEVKTAQAPAPANPAPVPAPAAAAAPLDPEKPVYAGLIEPIFAAKCIGCHGEKKQKGKLAMHTWELVMKGGDSGEPSLVAGKSADSLFIKRISLPADEDEHMPPKDKDQLTEKEVKILKWWIDGGLKNDVKIKDSGLPDDLK